MACLRSFLSRQSADRVVRGIHMVMADQVGDAEVRGPVHLGFESWYRTARPKVATSLALAIGDRDLAADVTDEAFVRVLQRWKRVSEFEHLTAYVYRVAFNLARRRLRRRAVADRLLPLVARAERNSPTDELWMVVSGLPQRRRTAVILRHVGRLSEPEIAEVMGVTRGTVSRSLRAAYDQLRIDTVGNDPNPGVALAKGGRDGRC